MTWLRALMLLCLIVWIGGIIFFAFVLAPTVFTVLPTRELAGNVVNPSLNKLHWMGLISGILFLSFSLLYNRQRYAEFRAVSAAHVLIAVMLVLTAVSQFTITPRMTALRREMGVIDNMQSSDARRMEFNQLHVWSTRTEGGVLFLGLVLVALTSRRFS
jgi:uncharacterized membrane protein